LAPTPSQPLPLAGGNQPAGGKELFAFGFWRTLVDGYNQIVQKAILFAGLLVLMALILNLSPLLLRIGLSRARIVANRKIFPGAVSALAVLALLAIFDKLMFIKFVPHALQVQSFFKTAL
jgi:hypothetical protein